jgi:hypothetical protein
VHGALLVGKRHAIAPRKAEWQRELATFKVELYCDSKLVQPGGGSLVLDSPLAALGHLIELLASDLHNPPLRAGEIISTGTLTPAMPVKLGERWTRTTLGVPLEGIAIRFGYPGDEADDRSCCFWSDAGRGGGARQPVRRAHAGRDRRDAPRCQDNGKNAPRTRFPKDRRHAPTRELMRLWTDLISPTGSNMWTSGRSV